MVNFYKCYMKTGKEDTFLMPDIVLPISVNFILQTISVKFL